MTTKLLRAAFATVMLLATIASRAQNSPGPGNTANSGTLTLASPVNTDDTASQEDQLPPLIHAHAHNDYEHEHPLFDALGHGFASVEADIHLVNGQLLVAHNLNQVNLNLTLQALYLDPLRARARKFGGRIYPNGDPTFYLLIDVKSEANATYAALSKVLQDYSDLVTKFDGGVMVPKAVTVVVTGNRPLELLPTQSVRLAGLDGRLPDLDKPNPNGAFLWMSDIWGKNFTWRGKGPIPADEKARVQDICVKAHERHMKVRFWNAPQSASFWRELRIDGVDLLNADDLAGLEKFLREEPSVTSLCRAEMQNPIPLWPNGAPGALGTNDWDIPTVTPYLPEPGSATGAAMVICSGGGYAHLGPHEGNDYALWLNQHGVTCFVLKYRLASHGYHHPAMLQDATRAVRWVRANADDYKIDTHRVGIMGSSAGGHLASTLMTHFDGGDTNATDVIERQSSRPDLGILCYPVISLGQFAHQGSKTNLLGKNQPPELVRLLSNELQVTPQTPPCFIWTTDEDKTVPMENSLLFAEALRKNHVPFDLHIYEKGRHGMGLKDKPPFAHPHPWANDCLFWLKAQNFVN